MSTELELYLLNTTKKDLYLSWYTISKSNELTWLFVQQHLYDKEYKWNWKGLSINTNIPWTTIKNNINSSVPLPWDWNGLSSRLDITWQDITEQNPNYNWAWHIICANPIINGKLVRDNITKPWIWDELSLNKSIFWDDVVSMLDKPWNWSLLSINPNITYEIAKNNPSFKWSWEKLYNRRFGN
jgi:hypothetical protein